jgi:hypothetical protein
MFRANIPASEIPGAVLLIARHGKIAISRALACSTRRQARRRAKMQLSAFTR